MSSGRVSEVLKGSDKMQNYFLHISPEKEFFETQILDVHTHIYVCKYVPLYVVCIYEVCSMLVY